MSRQTRGLVLAALLITAMASAGTARAADTFQKPTKEELEMKLLPGYPGAAAVVLFREEITKDDLHVVQHYERIKILTEEGKKYANVELGFFSTQGTGGDFMGNDKTVDDISGRTIHSDGTIIPFAGKPYLKVVEKGKARDEALKEDVNFKMQQKVFTLPDVDVGSIIEYRYSTRIADHVFEAPDWYIQGDLYVKSAHFQWFPTLQELVDGETQAPINSISWFPILPPGAKIENTSQPTGGGKTQLIYNLNVKDVPPVVEEDYMPPISSYTYRVLFNFTEYRTGLDYWTSEGKRWSKRMNSFMNTNSDVIAATNAVIAGAATQDQKLRKIYAAIMAMQNSRFTRRQEASEGKVSNATDVISRKRGTPDQLSQAFVSMARAAGMKAYLMTVPDRSENLFLPAWLSFRQFDALIAVVNVDGKEMYFDPGERGCAYGHLAWQHTFVKGLRQTDNGTDFASTSGDNFSVNKTARVANLNMDAQGKVTGKIDLTYEGSQALQWRQTALRGDDESLKHDLRTHLEKMLPNTLTVKVAAVQNLEDYDKPLLVNYSVEGTMGTTMGKRVLIPADIFLLNEHALFSHEKRENAVYFDYAQRVQDALRLNLPPGMSLEAVPDPAQLKMKEDVAYGLNVTHTPTNFTTRRDFVMASIVVLPADYAGLRTFYSQLQTTDQETVSLKPAASVAAAP